MQTTPGGSAREVAEESFLGAIDETGASTSKKESAFGCRLFSRVPFSNYAELSFARLVEVDVQVPHEVIEVEANVRNLVSQVFDVYGIALPLPFHEIGKFTGFAGNGERKEK